MTHNIEDNIMLLLTIGKVHLEHVLSKLDTIRKCFTPLPIAHKDGRKWSCLYVSYAKRGGIASCMRETDAIHLCSFRPMRFPLQLTSGATHDTV